MGGAELNHRQPVRIGAETPIKREEGSISTRFFRKIGRGVSSGVSALRKLGSSTVPPLVEDIQESNSQNSASSSGEGRTLSREERVVKVGELLDQIGKKELFWEQDVETFFEKVNEIFDPQMYGSTDECNQNCCKAVVAVSNFLFTQDKKWPVKLKKFGAQNYFGWAAMNSKETNVREVALKFLIKIEGPAAVHKLTSYGI